MRSKSRIYDFIYRCAMILTMDDINRQLLDQAITNTFMWNFKKGDNIVYNFGVIWALYDAKSGANSTREKKMYIKPIILLQMSIVECILDDFVNRVKDHVYDKVPNISDSQIENFKTKKSDRLENYIAAAKKHNLFNRRQDFYTTMDRLRQARNRFHIQNTKNTPPLNEHDLFTEALLVQCEEILETVVHTMMSKFYRGIKPELQFSKVPLPWPRRTHLPDFEDASLS